VELFADGLPVIWNLLFPRSPVLLLLVDVELEYSVTVREHWFNITEDVVDFTATCFVNGGTNRPNDAEHKPLLNVEQEISSILLFSLL